jgi:nucleoside-diphosphate-sugar epimerase
VVAALSAPSGIYNIVDDRPLSRDEYVDALTHALGVPSPHVRSADVELPTELSAIVRSLRVSNQRFRDATGWRPRFPSAWEGWASVVAEWRAQQAPAGSR